MKASRLTWSVTAALLLAGDAGAVRAPAKLDEQALEPAVGQGRRSAPMSVVAPPSARRSWQQWTGAFGPRWRALWDLDRDVPLRLYGEGIAFAGASADPVVAEAAAWRMLDEHLGLLAPGAQRGDFVPLANLVHGRGGGLRTVTLAQRSGGLAVLGGAVSFLFKRDRLIVVGSTAARDVRVSAPSRLVDDGVAAEAAVAWIARLYGARPRVISVAAEAVVLPVTRARDDAAAAATARPIEPRVVRTVVVDLDVTGAPRGRWSVYLDAVTGAPVARAQTLRFGSGTLQYDAPVRRPGGQRMDYPAVLANLTIDGVGHTADAAGSFTFTGPGPVDLFTSVTGARVRVIDSGGPGAVTQLSVPDGGVARWSGAAFVGVDAQLSAFVHAGIAKAYAKAELAPELAWLDQQLEVGVNERGSCNAFSNGDDIHFILGGDGCENSARIADIVYHEVAHSLHNQAVIPGAGVFEVALSEGAADYFAATITGDPATGVGFILGTDAPVRHIDPVGDEARYPADLAYDPHVSGLIISGALWDLRKSRGQRLADDALMAALRRAADIPSAYVEILAADDDDGDLANGTPNKCAIDAAFLPHGLVELAAATGLGLPQHDDLVVHLPVSPPADLCPDAQVTAATLTWRQAGETASQDVSMTAAIGGFTGTLPAPAAGTVLEYRVVATLASGATFAFPDHAAEPWFQRYAAPVVPLYCFDFETDPFAAGWTHSASFGPSDWEWGPARRSPGTGDPATAWSGTHVVGTDLGVGSDGIIEPGVETRLRSPVFDVAGHQNVRLQYRRWLGSGDRASILADGGEIWTTFEEIAQPEFADTEWRAHDLSLASESADGLVQVTFVINSFFEDQHGGWNLDDVCIVAGASPGDLCGDGTIAGSETCEDGNVTAGDGCSSVCRDEPPGDDDDDGETGGGCCSGGGGGGGLGAAVLSLAALLGVGRRRRRSDTVPR